MRSEEFRRTLAPPAHSTLPNLVVQRPERYRRTIDRSNGQSILVFDVASAADIDWLEHAILDQRLLRAAWRLGARRRLRQARSSPRCWRRSRRRPRSSSAAPSGAVLQCLRRARESRREGVDISAMAIAQAVRARPCRGSTRATSCRWTCRSSYDLLFGLDVFEHLNPNKLDAYIAPHRRRHERRRVSLLQHPGVRRGRGLRNGVSVLRRRLERRTRRRGRPLRGIHVDEHGYPIHGHLVWADAAWWTRAIRARRLHARRGDRARVPPQVRRLHGKTLAGAASVLRVRQARVGRVAGPTFSQRIAAPSRLI